MLRLGFHTSIAPLVELLHQAFKAQTGYTHNQPEARSSVEAIYQQLQELLEQHSPLILTSSKGCLWHQDKPIRNAPAATQAIAKEMELRGFNGMAFYAGIDYEELELCIFAMQLPVNRLREMGGVRALTPEGANISFLGAVAGKPTLSERTAQLWPSMPQPPRAVTSGQL